MGSRSVHYDAALFLFLPAFPQLAGRPCIRGDRTVDQVAVIRLQFTVCFYFIAAAACGRHLTVTDQRRSCSAYLVHRSRHANGGGYSLAPCSHVNHTGIIGNGLVALRSHAHVARAGNICVFNLCCGIILNKIIASGSANCRGSLHRYRSAHGHAGYVASGRGADIQITCVQGCCRRFIRIGHGCPGIVLYAVHACRHHAGQEGIRAGNFQRRRACIHFRSSIRLHRNQRRFAAPVFINRGILHTRSIVLVDSGIRPQALGGYQRFCRNTDACCYSSCLGFVRRSNGNAGALIVFRNCGYVSVIDLGPQGFPAGAGLSSLIAFRQGHAGAQSCLCLLYGQLERTGRGRPFRIVCCLYIHGSRIGNHMPVLVRHRNSIVMSPFLADHRNCIVMSPVGGEASIGCHNTRIRIVRVYPHGNRKRRGVVISVQGNRRSRRGIPRPDLVLCKIDAGGIFHPVHCHTQAHRIPAAGKFAGHIHNMGSILGRALHRIRLNAAVFRIFAVPVPGDRHNIILLQIVPGNRSRAAEGAFADTGPCRQGNDIGMDVRFPVNIGGFHLFIPGNIGAGYVGHPVDGHSRSGRNAFAFRHFCRHIDHRIASFCSHGVLCGVAQVAEPGTVYFPCRQIFFIRVILF